MSNNKPSELASQNPLGQSVEYVNEYQPNLLFAIARSEKRLELNISDPLPFVGEDIWNAYELSWLNLNGVPRVATAEFRFSAESAYIVESKSFKLYLNSFNQTQFKDQQTVSDTIKRDLENACQAKVLVKIIPIDDQPIGWDEPISSKCVDDVDIKVDSYQYDPSLLVAPATQCHSQVIEQNLCSHLLKSNCLITSQPDWASVYIRYKGVPISEAGLLAYIISFRNHNEFHEQCVERIFSDIMTYCKPEKLTVYARYTRRGGLDINPWRSNYETTMPNIRLVRQ
jgi:7-cyano-7-deazaguanine reductase